MPTGENWLHNPLAVINRIFGENCECNSNEVTKVKEYFEKNVQNGSAEMWIPSLNSVAGHKLPSHCLVRYRGMVQDMFGPEYYLGRYEVEDVKLGACSMKCGVFRDIAECEPHQSILLNSSNNKTMERETLYVVPTPGENNWVRDMFASQYKAVEEKCESGQKRALEEDNETEEHVQEESLDVKKPKTQHPSANNVKSDVDLNLPLAGEKGPACLVKLYDNSESLKVNDIVEFIGILSNDPQMVAFPDNQNKVDEMMMEEERAHNPPPSLVPRLHVILTRKLAHTNPTLPQHINTSPEGSCEETRHRLLALLQTAVCGDSLTAEYLLLHLISTVYTRRDVIALGKFALNIRDFPTATDFVSKFYEFLQLLLPKSYLLPLTIDHLNSSKFSPSKDYGANRLTSGVLQLSDNTQLVVDETRMEAGQLQPTGVSNLEALGNVITWQKVVYDFTYHKQDFPCNIRVLILSQTKSLLKCDSEVKLCPEEPVTDVSGHFSVLQDALTSALLTEFRSFLGYVQMLDHTLPDSLQKEVEEDFVASRKENPENMSVEDLHSLLVLTRLMSLSYGMTTSNSEIWKKTKQLETQRKQRLAAGQ